MSVSELVSAKPAIDEAKARAKRKAQRRAALMRQMVQWHWISAAVCLIGMLLFAITGITLNHAGAIEAKPQTVEVEGQLPPELIAVAKAAQAKQGALPDDIRAWLAKEVDAKAPKGAAVEWTDAERLDSIRAGPKRTPAGSRRRKDARRMQVRRGLHAHPVAAHVAHQLDDLAIGDIHARGNVGIHLHGIQVGARLGSTGRSEPTRRV